VIGERKKLFIVIFMRAEFPNFLCGLAPLKKCLSRWFIHHVETFIIITTMSLISMPSSAKPFAIKMGSAIEFA